MRSAIAATLLCAAALITAAPANAAPDWQPPVKVEAAPSAAALSFPKIAARPGGCTMVAFERGEDVYASTRPAAGSFAPTQDLGPIAPGRYPDFATGGGRAALAWDGGSAVRVAVAGGCEALPAAATVPDSDATAEEPVVAVDGSGRAIVAFEAGGSGSRRIYVSELPAGGSPTDAAPIAPPAGTEAFRAKLAANGGAVGLAFDVISGGSQVYGSLRTGPGSWLAPVQLNAVGKPALPGKTEVAIGADGSLHAAWIDAGNKEVILATLAPSGTVSRTSLITAGGTVREPAIATDAAGRLAVVWAEQIAGGSARIYGKYREPGGVLSSQRPISPATAEFRGNPRAVIDSQGRTVVTWSEVAAMGATQETAAATRPPGNNFFFASGTISDETLDTQPSDISTDADGNTATVLFVTDVAFPREAQVAAFDAAGPMLGELAAPSGLLGDELPFSVTAVDAWSPPTTSTWDFGDGGSATGSSVSHSYGAPGSFAVKATVTDAFGNPSEASGTVDVAGRPVPPPTGPGSGGGDGSGDDGGHRNGGPGGKDITAPRIAKLKILPRRFPVSAKARISFKLSEPARLRLAIKPRGGSFKRAGKAGRNTIVLPAKLRRALAPRAYTLRIVASDGSGNRTRAATRFTVLHD